MTPSLSFSIWEWTHGHGATTRRSDLLKCRIMDELFQAKREDIADPLGKNVTGMKPLDL